MGELVRELVGEIKLSELQVTKGAREQYIYICIYIYRERERERERENPDKPHQRPLCL